MATRATTVCAMVLKKKDGPIRGMTYIVIVLDPLLGTDEYDEAGIDPSRMFQLKDRREREFGDWYMILGTGCAIRVSLVAGAWQVAGQIRWRDIC